MTNADFLVYLQNSNSNSKTVSTCTYSLSDVVLTLSNNCNNIDSEIGNSQQVNLTDCFSANSLYDDCWYVEYELDVYPTEGSAINLNYDGLLTIAPM